MDSFFIISLFESLPLWVMLLPILACSILLTAIFLERFFFYRKINFDYQTLAEKAKVALEKDQNFRKDFIANNFLKSNPLSLMIKNILLKWDLSSDKESLIRGIASESIAKIEKYAGTVSTIATVSPMFGLLGTVTGMMRSFSGLAEYGPAVQTQLAQGITEALITTALGLMVAIPALIFYNYLVAKANFYIKEIEYLANIFDKS